MRNIDVPMLMHRGWLLKSGAVFHCRTGPALQPVALPQHAPDAGWAHCDKIGVDHHLRQSSVADVRIEHLEVEDLLLFPLPHGQ